jgi:hypothetical protein
VTHKDLFLENPVKLPFVSDVPLPLVAFFILAPVVFIVSHAYTLVHFVMLAAKVGVFNRELQTQLGNAEETKEYLRWQLPANIFVQLLAGPERLRGGRLGFLSNRIAWISLVIGPILLLLLIQVQFLPFHSEGITWLHRVFVLVDVVLLWALWPAVVDGGSKIGRPPRWRQKWLALGGSAAIGLAVTAATFPGESMEEWAGKWQWFPHNLAAIGLGKKDESPKWTSFHDFLFNGEYNPITIQLASGARASFPTARASEFQRARSREDRRLEAGSLRIFVHPGKRTFRRRDIRGRRLAQDQSGERAPARRVALVCKASGRAVLQCKP